MNLLYVLCRAALAAASSLSLQLPAEFTAVKARAKKESGFPPARE